ncbi:MAG: acetyl-CoA carboxylase biotin carboxylase subunit [Chloroflexi bacterium]|jgi:3-methylcrotonyl-CoA carboxylase alpha subunit|nr:acetyl-CoA carboxylase biotin carboxylase subunit [Chloroflexota bacterium]MBT3670084.1 acetyl-CoA carboxylase biotin carboxylase subunit [Chloroflexota bacterium]MBT4682237.1 acetyl-CoA carboxylase biotin carboxylase subunit [Chloroflexota bacterium]MBT4755771.1 acetyl-CoA carboxylase biotin carboxylase subunit [Chloroflexota bacterium]MBT5336589.1 acetyl-CoA carboxylase biotin carboxylase subunit [Chloroflexota bacterium]
MTTKPPFEKILIANRGEIALRLMRACQELGISTVAVYSEADHKAPHVDMADEAILIGPAPPLESYLKIENILVAAKESGAEAVHPGYGFLSENTDFAQAVIDAGLVFIGPSPDAIRLMGDKSAARQLMEKAGIPLIPGYQGDDDLKQLKKKAVEIGYPVLLKAAAGGGGKGMRVVTEPADLQDLLSAARREAQNSFGDSRIILEKYISDAHHIEFQILADGHGNVLHFFERECSIQRRHQKVIEESPSPLMDDALREEMARTAIEVATSVNYTNAGTVEFIVDPASRKFYFLEMNTRLQVEHPITEMVTGIDLVQWQIRIAAGEKLPFKQSDLKQKGHAIEARIYAEDPSNSFFPSTGRIHHVGFADGEGVRVDSGVVPGTEVGVHYDPLLAKVIAYADDRPKAIKKLMDALRNSVLLGLKSNREFLVDILQDKKFNKGLANTRFIDSFFSDWHPMDKIVPDEVLIIAAIAELSKLTENRESSGEIGAESDPYSPWSRFKNFRIGGKES